MNQTNKHNTTLERVRDHRVSILNIANQHGAHSMCVFGYVVRDEDTKESDIDFLAQFEPSRHLLDLIALQHDLEDLLKRAVDVLTEDSISPYLKNQILHKAVVL